MNELNCTNLRVHSIPCTDEARMGILDGLGDLDIRSCDLDEGEIPDGPIWVDGGDSDNDEELFISCELLLITELVISILTGSCDFPISFGGELRRGTEVTELLASPPLFVWDSAGCESFLAQTTALDTNDGETGETGDLGEGEECWQLRWNADGTEEGDILFKDIPETFRICGEVGWLVPCWEVSWLVLWIGDLGVITCVVENIKFLVELSDLGGISILGFCRKHGLFGPFVDIWDSNFCKIKWLFYCMLLISITSLHIYT